MNIRRIAGAVVAVAALAVASEFAGAQDGPPARPPAPVVVAHAEARDLRTTQEFVGAVRAKRMSLLGAEVAGLVVEVFAEDGDHVKAGEPLLRLRSTPAEARVAGAKAEVERLQAVLSELEAGPRAEDIEAARADVREAEASLAYAKWRQASTEKLRREGRSSEDELELAKSEAASATARLARLQAVLARLVAGTRSEQIAAAKAELSAQRARTAELEDMLERHTLRAPYTGFVAEHHAEVGAWLSEGETAFRFVELEPAEIEVPVPEDRVAFLRPGQTARVAVGALDAHVMEGEIVTIVPVGDARARTFPVRIRVENEIVDGVPRLLAGMTARVTLPVGQITKALVVPKDALVIGARGAIVQVVRPAEGAAGQGNASPVPVRVGIAHDDMVQIEAELEPGTLVVIRGNERLMPGQPVQFEAPKREGN